MVPSLPWLVHSSPPPVDADVAKEAGALHGVDAAPTDGTAKTTERITNPEDSGTESTMVGALAPPPIDADVAKEASALHGVDAAPTDGTAKTTERITNPEDSGTESTKVDELAPPPVDEAASPVDEKAEESVPSVRTPYSESSDESNFNGIDNREIPTDINAIQEQKLSPIGSPGKKQRCMEKSKVIPVHPVVLGLMLPRLSTGRIVCINTNHNDPKPSLIGEITNRIMGNPTNACIENHKNGDITSDQLIAHAYIGEKDALTKEVSDQQVNTKWLNLLKNTGFQYFFHS